MNDSDFNDCCDFIKRKLPETNCDFTDLAHIVFVLQKILDEHIITLSANGIHHDYWPDDEELSEIETFYNMIKYEIYIKNSKK